MVSLATSRKSISQLTANLDVSKEDGEFHVSGHGARTLHERLSAMGVDVSACVKSSFTVTTTAFNGIAEAQNILSALNSSAQKGTTLAC